MSDCGTVTKANGPGAGEISTYKQGRLRFPCESEFLHKQLL